MMLTIGFPETKPQSVDGYLCRDGLGTMVIWLGKRKDIHHVVDELDKGAWEEIGCSPTDWLECEIINNVAYSSERHEIPKTAWPKPGKCVRVKVLMR